MKYGAKLRICGLFFLSLTICACGRGEPPGVVQDMEEDVLVPVAEFQDMKLPVPLEAFRLYTCNDEWFYAAGLQYDSEKQKGCWYIYRGRAADEFMAE